MFGNRKHRIRSFGALAPCLAIIFGMAVVPSQVASATLIPNHAPLKGQSRGNTRDNGSGEHRAGWYVNQDGEKRFSSNTVNPNANWNGVCTGGANRFKKIKDYNRAKAHGRMKRKYARMYCGLVSKHGKTHAFGIRHIRHAHKTAFTKLANLEGRTWGDWMNWALMIVFTDPDRRTVQSTTRFCYQHKFYFKNQKGEVTKTRQVVGILGKTGVRLMTAFPSKSNLYCKGKTF